MWIRVSLWSSISVCARVCVFFFFLYIYIYNKQVMQGCLISIHKACASVSVYARALCPIFFLWEPLVLECRQFGLKLVDNEDGEVYIMSKG